MQKKLNVKTIETLPENFHEFRDGFSDHVGALYGSYAAASIKSSIKRIMNAQLHQDNVLTWAAEQEDGKTVGLLFLALHGDRAKITMLHILSDYRNRQIENQLMEAVIETVQHSGITTILFDTALDEAFELDKIPGVQLFPRLMMRLSAAELAAQQLGGPIVTMPIEGTLLPAVAACIVSAYQHHTDSLIYREVREKSEAVYMVEQAMAGNFGQTYPQWMRMIWDGKQCRGGVLATRLFPDTVFILQLFVHSEYQRQGNGRLLLTALAKAVETEAPGNNLVLCVSADNPARHLYAHLGFTPFYETSVYLWEK